MRFHLGAIPENKEFLPNAEGWRDIREPGPIAVQILTIPVAIFLFIIWGILVELIAKQNNLTFNITSSDITLSKIILYMVIIILFIPLHEIIHALVALGWGFTSKTVIGFWVSKFLFYAHYDGSMSRNRFIFVFITPYIIFGLLPTFLMGIFPGLLQYLLLLTLLGSVLACGDILGAGFILFSIPKNAIVRNKGWKTYWKNT